MAIPTAQKSSLPKELHTIHKSYVRSLLQENDIKVRKFSELDRSINWRVNNNFPAAVPGPKTLALLNKDQTAELITESLPDDVYNRLRRAYMRVRNVQNILIFRWIDDGSKVSCILELLTRNEFKMLVKTNELGILPSVGANSITIKLGGDYKKDIVFDISAMRHEFRDGVETHWPGREAAGAPDAPPEPLEPKPPTSKEEFKTAMFNMVNILGLDKLYGEQEMNEFAEKAARNVNAALTDLGLPKSATIDLIKTNLFRCYIFCDDSGSMAGSLFNKTLKEIVRRMVPLATRLNENGVSLRFINYDGDSNYDDIKEGAIDAYMNTVRPCGGTLLGQALENKVVGPLVNSLNMGADLRPTLISIITDGEATDKDAVEATIKRCKQALVDKGIFNNRTYGMSSVIFQIHFVGSDPSALEFINRLDTNIGDFIFCNKRPLDKEIINDDVLEAQKNRMLLKVMSSAIDRAIESRG